KRSSSETLPLDRTVRLSYRASRSVYLEPCQQVHYLFEDGRGILQRLLVFCRSGCNGGNERQGNYSASSKTSWRFSFATPWCPAIASDNRLRQLYDLLRRERENRFRRDANPLPFHEHL